MSYCIHGSQGCTPLRECEACSRYRFQASAQWQPTANEQLEAARRAMDVRAPLWAEIKELKAEVERLRAESEALRIRDELKVAEVAGDVERLRKLLAWFDAREEYLGSFDYDDWMRNNPKPEGGE